MERKSLLKQNMILQSNDQIHQKLFKIVSRRKSYQGHSSVIIPGSPEPIRPELLIGNPASKSILELGAGSGEFAIQWILRNPDHNYVAFEVKGDRIKTMIRGMDRHDIKNIRIIPVNFKWFLTEILPPNLFDMIIVNFPDPWPKKRHWKHRLVDVHFPEKAAYLLKPGGIIHMATDYGPYARRILSIFRKNGLFSPVFTEVDYRRQRPEDFPTTRFEKIHEKDGKRSYYQQWRLK